MIANWAIGQDAGPAKVAQTMKVVPFGVVIITLSTAVAETTRIAKFFRTLWDPSQFNEEEVDLNEVVKDHAVLRLSQRVYVVVHRAKIVGCQYFPFTIHNSSTRIDMGTLRLDKDVTRQRMDSISVGILDARHGASRHQIEAIEEWITCDIIVI